MNHSRKEKIPSVLTIAGSDSGGGAGIQADLRTFYAHRVFGHSAICAVTAQNPYQVKKIDLMSPEMVEAQIAAVLEVFSPGAVKTGMIGSAELIEIVSEALAEIKVPLIVDPVMIAGSGAVLLPPEAIHMLKTKLLPIASWITPNIPEVEALSGLKIHKNSDMEPAARSLSEIWNCGCLVKGGHLSDGNIASDIVSYKGDSYELSSPIVDIDGQSTHGTGCTLSAAFAAGLARGLTWQEAICNAKAFVYGSLVECVELNPNIFAMYPPEKNCISKISITRIGGTS
ncbi:MAG: bifunctional hydroxymethylpyrimidine kinase/phosphomethylpyrimidine kinase [Lentisphaerae bacterium]|nr:bifunctional hydroxymethylpyrimidine kinase/phosphomethylpyrimidine kinase [Victivallaceae bacterium]MDD3116786.1 bifunctional hydroxymethylpyrimidine kinase/phosphomethylpyrimidine kinase [Victivallaceae bacterium]MDD3703141.1 bifunctional hydroxymethylpyrimidine kinase/phosphomethylpyrimidine kinase [Victivallaceae bacterium]MDD5663421.1 bifunctional hydroxymethylpyrimidine kinase/phosphomethylpyrimidine kinase [Victivallaceae bacterium]NLK83101.1 bifunctional hydroxymethylpyrimidine kinas